MRHSLRHQSIHQSKWLWCPRAQKRSTEEAVKGTEEVVEGEGTEEAGETVGEREEGGKGERAAVKAGGREEEKGVMEREGGQVAKETVGGLGSREVSVAPEVGWAAGAGWVRAMGWVAMAGVGV